MKIHELKILDKYFNEIMLGNKTAELRFNDRDYEVGDLIYFNELVIDGKLVPNNADKIEGYYMMLYITHIISDTSFLQPGYIMISFKVMHLYPKIGFHSRNTNPILEAHRLNQTNHRQMIKWLQSKQNRNTYIL